MSRPSLDCLLKRLNAEGGLDRYRVGTAEVGSAALAEKADVGTRLFLGIAIDWDPRARRRCRLLRVPFEGGGLYVLTVEGRLEALAAALTFEDLERETERLELRALWSERPLRVGAAR